VCRAGCGIERKPNSCETPGFGSTEIAQKIFDPRGFYRIHLPRTDKLYLKQKLIQTSIPLVQSWRANCDMQFIMYTDNHEEFPNAEEIGRVTDYIVAYTCKGNESFLQEKQVAEALILNEKEKMGDSSDVKALAKKIMNNSIKTKLISKQEAICQTIGLPLYNCSENIFRLSLSGIQKLSNDNSKTFKPILQQYASRPLEYENESLFNFVKRFWKTKNSSKTENKGALFWWQIFYLSPKNLCFN
jgi:hypothetical protein